MPYDKDNEKYTDFVKNYKQRFGIKPNLASVNSYIAVFTLSKAITRPERLFTRKHKIQIYEIR